MSENPNPVARLGTMNGTRRFIVIGAALAVIAVLWITGQWASQPTYVTLYRDLELGESGAITEQLGKSNIDFRLESGGTEVLVPVAEAARARVALAREGLPANGRPGLELFDKPSWGMTDFTQRVTYQRALEGELARTIGGLRGIQRAQVHLLMPQPSALRKQDRPAGASVLLTLQGGSVLSPETVQGITYIVSNSVEGLSAENVAVMDDAGHVLTVPSTTGAGPGLTARQLDLQRSMEQHLSEKIEALLATVVGMGRARAQVAAQLSFDQVDQMVETYDPDGQVLQTEQRSETGNAATETAGNAQTVISNQYQNSRRVEKSVGAAGKVTLLTVAVLVDEAAVRAGGANLRPENLEAMVRNAIGADSARGDRISVMSVPFGDAASAAAAVAAAGAKDAPKADPVELAERFSRPAIGLIAIVAVLIVAFRAFQLAAPRGGKGGAAPAGGWEPGVLPPRPAAPEAPAALRGRSAPVTVEGPETAAQVVRAWLAETR